MDKKMMLLYYPYHLRVVDTNHPSESLVVTELFKEDFEAKGWWDKQMKIPYDSERYKIVLHALSDLRTPLKINKHKVDVADMICKIVTESMNVSLGKADADWIINTVVGYFSNLPSKSFSHKVMNQIYNILLTLHFDISGSIEKKEAIDVAELKFDPYEFDHIMI